MRNITYAICRRCYAEIDISRFYNYSTFTIVKKCKHCSDDLVVEEIDVNRFVTSGWSFKGGK